MPVGLIALCCFRNDAVRDPERRGKMAIISSVLFRTPLPDAQPFPRGRTPIGVRHQPAEIILTLIANSTLLIRQTWRSICHCVKRLRCFGRGRLRGRFGRRGRGDRYRYSWCHYLRPAGGAAPRDLQPHR